MNRLFRIGLTFLLALLFSVGVEAQLSKLPVEKMSDEQLVTLLAQQQLLGLTPARFEIEASTRGLSQKQILIIRERMERMDPFMISKTMSQLKEKEIDPTACVCQFDHKDLIKKKSILFYRYLVLIYLIKRVSALSLIFPCPHPATMC